jgi:hypothetical protein
VRKQWSVIVGVVAVVIVLAAVAVAAVVARERMQAAEVRACLDQLKEYPPQVSTERWFPPEEVTDLGVYTEIHWQTRVQGECGVGFSSVRYLYQGVVRLRPEDATAVAKRITQTPQPSPEESATEESATEESDPEAPDTATSSPAPVVTSAVGAVPAEIWPDLAPFVPRGVTWVHNQAYDDAQGLGRVRSLYVDPKRSVAFFEITEG